MTVYFYPFFEMAFPVIPGVRLGAAESLGNPAEDLKTT